METNIAGVKQGFPLVSNLQTGSPQHMAGAKKGNCGKALSDIVRGDGSPRLNLSIFNPLEIKIVLRNSRKTTKDYSLNNNKDNPKPNQELQKRE